MHLSRESINGMCIFYKIYLSTCGLDSVRIEIESGQKVISLDELRSKLIDKLMNFFDILYYF